MHLTLSRRYIGRALGTVVALLALAHFALGHLDEPWVRLFDLDEEGSFGTWAIAVFALFGGSLSLLLAAVERREQRVWLWWTILGLVLLALSVDEVAQVHEGLGAIASRTIRGDSGGGMAGTFYLGVAILPGVLFGIWVIFRTSIREASRLLVAGLAIFWAGAFGVEYLELLNYERRLWLTRSLSMETGDFLLTGVQETMELAGVTLMIMGFLSQLTHRRATLEVDTSD